MSLNRYDENLKLKEELDNVIEDLYITSKFPPLNDVSGIVLSKRIIKLNKKVDVLYADLNGDKDFEINSLIDNFIEDRIVVEGNYTPSSVHGVNYFRKEGLKKLNELNKQYKHIVSRSWTIESHFLALDYKFQNPNVVWTAEFSDPLHFDVNNNLRKSPFNADEDFFKKINNKIHEINIELFSEDESKYFPKIKNGDNLYFLVEYLPFLFADVIRFTNKNQREVMLDSFPVDIEDYVLKKSEVSNHPTLDKEYYFLKNSNYNVDGDYLNFAYFGTYLGKRHLEYLFKSFEELNDSIRDKIKLHLFVPNPDLIKLNLNDLSFFKNIEIGEKIPFLEFLNLTTKMDVLIVNDLLTEGVFEINPYLPSKLADYLGSGTDIWFITEKGSSMDNFSTKYKSNIGDYDFTKNILKKIISDKVNLDSNIFRDVGSDEYYHNRLTNLNNILEDVYKQRIYWLNQNNLSKNKLNELNKNIQDNNLRISSLSDECGVLREDIRSRDERISSLSDECVSLNNEIENLKNSVISANSEKKRLCDGYFELHEITQDSFDLIELKDKIIKDKNVEIDYYKNHGNVIGRFISNHLEKLYLTISSSKDELKLNMELYELLTSLDWFNKGYYIRENEDISKFKWVKLFSPELHYICHGFDEGRLPNRETKSNNSKKDLLKKLKYIKNS